MDRQNVGIGALIVATLAGLAVGFPFVASNSPGLPTSIASSQQPANRAQEEHALPKHTALDALMDSFDDDPAQALFGRIWSQTPSYWPPRALDTSPVPRNLRVIIASLPDPTAPALRKTFDDLIDAIQLGAETADYQLESVDLPWPRSASNPAAQSDQEVDLRCKHDGDQSAASDPLNRLCLSAIANTDESPRYLIDPGILLFKDRKDSSNLLVFIVGETPTTGVHKRALRNALDQTAWLCGWEDSQSPDSVDERVFGLVKCDDNELRLLAPANSGTDESIQLTLRAWHAGLAPAKQPHVTMISGTASFASFPDTWISFSRTFATVSYFREFVQPRYHPEQTKIAMLVEADTVYGQNIDASSSSVLAFQFPMYISDVRQASGKRTGGVIQSPLRQTNIKLPTDENGVIDYLPLHYSSRSAASDQIVLENLLETIHRERIRYIGIAAGDVEDRIFLAQQIRDCCPDTSVFLLDSDLIYLHSDFNADLRGTVVFSTYPLFAKNSLWTYPFERDRGRHQFPNDTAEGVFNATLALLGRSDEMEDYGAPFVRKPSAPVLWASVVGKDNLWPLGYYVLPSPESASFWVSVINDDDLWPLSDSMLVDFNNLNLASTDPKLEFPESGVRLIDRGLYPGSFIVLFLLATLVVGGWHLLLLAHYPPKQHARWGRLRSAAESTHPVWLDSLVGFSVPLDDSKDVGLIHQRRGFLLAISIGGLALYVIIATFLVLPYGWAIFGSFGGTIDWFPHSLASCLAIAAIAICFAISTVCAYTIVSLFLRYDSLMRLRSTVQAETATPATHLNVSAPKLSAMRSCKTASLKRAIWSCLKFLASPVATAVCFAIAAVAYCVSISVPSSHSGWHYGAASALYLFYRGTRLGNGVSPMVPILLLGAGALVLLFGSLRRIAILRISRHSDATLTFVGKFSSFNGTVWLENHLRQYLRQPPNELSGAGVFYAVGFLGAVWLLMRPNRSVDGPIFDILVLLAAFAVFVAVGCALLRVVLTWNGTKELLRRLYLHPSRSAYDRFHRALPGHRSLTFTDSTLPLTSVESSMDQVRQIVRLADITGAEALPADLVEKIEDLRKALPEAEEYLSDALRAESERRREDAVRSRAQAEASLSKLGACITALLEVSWREPANASGSITAGKQALNRAGEVFFASRVVDLLREVFPHFRNQMTCATIAILLTLLALSSYPFAQRDTLLTIAWLTVATAVGAMGYVFFAMNRDRVLSLLSGTTPGQITWNSTLVMQILVYGLLPVLGLLGIQFPEQFGSLLSWFSKVGGRPS